MQRNRDYYADFLSEEEDLQASVGPERDEEGVPATASNNASPGGVPQCSLSFSLLWEASVGMKVCTKALLA